MWPKGYFPRDCGFKYTLSVRISVCTDPLPDSDTQCSCQPSTPRYSGTELRCGSRAVASSARWPALCSLQSKRGRRVISVQARFQSFRIICDAPTGAHAKGRGAEVTDHFADAVLKRGHNGAQAPEFQDHAGQLVTRDATDGLQILCLVANVVSADGGAGTIHYVVVKGEKDIGSCQKANNTMRKVTEDALTSQPLELLVVKDISWGVRDAGGRGVCGE